MTKSLKFVSIIIIGIISFLFINADKVVVNKFPYQRFSLGEKENPIARAQYEFNLLKSPLTGKIPDGIKRKEKAFAQKLPKVSALGLAKNNNVAGVQFISRGPINRGGRTRALALDMRSTADNVTILAAGISGSIWRSSDNGATWTKVSSVADINSASCIAQDPRDGHQDTWYVGTGEFWGNSAGESGAPYRGDGIYKSTDNGLTWNLLTSTVSGTPNRFDSFSDYIQSIAVNPSTGTLFYASGINAIRRSTNGNDNWETVKVSKNGDSYMAGGTDITIASNGTIYASFPSGDDKGIWKSTDDGTNWTKITPSDFPGSVGRAVIAVAPSDANKVYLLAYTPGTGNNGTSLWVSDNEGSAWTNKTTNLPDTEGSVGGMDSQGGYNLVISVKPDDPNFVVFGGTNLHRTTDGFATKMTNGYTHWIGGYSVANDVSSYAEHHPDQHAAVFAPYNSDILYTGNDGGVQRTNSVSSHIVRWTELNTGYKTSQFYSISLDHATPGSNILLGGLQDNGHYFYNSTNPDFDWVEMMAGGDGTITAIANGARYYYIETQQGNLIRLELNSDGSWKTWTNASPDYSTDYSFVNPYALDPNDSKVMYFVANDSLWRNSNLLEIPNYSNDPTMKNWTALSHTATGYYISAVSVSTTPADIVYYGSAEGKIFKLENAKTGDPYPTDISTGKGLPADAYVVNLAIDPNNADNVIAVFSNYEVISLYYTSDGGQNWNPISGNLEENPDGTGNGPSCRWASILHDGDKTYYFVATSAGLYSTANLDGNNTIWTQESPDKIGVAVCTMVKTRQSDGMIAVATHGSGVFTGDIATGINNDNIETPNSFTLSQNYPNPFNPSTKIDFSLPQSDFVRLSVYNIKGEKVAELINEEKAAGNYSVTFDASNLASGTYIYKLQSGNFTQTKKMLLLK